MSFLKSLGTGVGQLVGGLTGGAIKLVGEVTDSTFIREVGDGVEKSTAFAGQQLGNVAQGVWNVGSGIVTKDDRQLHEGFNDIGEGVSKTAVALGQGIVHTAKNVGEVAGGLLDKDEQRTLDGVKNLGKTVLIGALAISVVDSLDGVDNVDATDVEPHDNATTTMENNNTHYVTPHERTLQSGEVIWVDGDGDTTVDRSTGWTQTNPNYRS